MYVPINGPEKTCLSFGLLAISLFTVETARNDTGKASQKLRLYSMYLSCYLCAYSAIPGLIAELTGVTHYTRFIIYYFIMIATLLYTAGTLIDHIKASSPISVEETIENIPECIEDQPANRSETEE